MRDTSWTCHSRLLAALMKKRKEEILRDKEQSTEQSTVHGKACLYLALVYLLFLP